MSYGILDEQHHRQHQMLSSLMRYGVALATVLLALVLKLAVEPLFEREQSPYLFFLAAVMVTAWYGGLMPGLLTVVLSGLVGNYLFLEPFRSLGVIGTKQQVLLAVFLLEGSLICLLSAYLHRARRQAESSLREARFASAESERNIAERRRVESALRVGEAKLRRLVNANLIGVFFCDLDGRVTDANDAFLRMLGYSRDDLKQDRVNWQRMTPEEFRDLDWVALEQLQRLGRCEPFEKEYLSRDGRPVPVLIGAAALEDRPDELVCFAVDLSEQKQFEHALESAKEEAEQANRAKSEFLANTSHELRTPMNAIIGMTQLALNEQLSDDVRDYLDTALDSAESLLRLLNDLLDFSKIEAGKFKLSRRAFDLQHLLDEVLKSLSVRAGEKGLRLTCHVDPRVPRRVVGDSLRLGQVLTNLVGNAVKFTEQGEVSVRIGLRERDQRRVRLQFEVSDTGIGISAEDQRRIFAPFTQADASITRAYGGTGLGLAIAAELIGMMHGQLSLRSEPGRGSTFTFTARFKRADRRKRPDQRPVKPPAAPPVPAPRRPLRVLIAEDMKANQRLVEVILKRRGHEVALAANGLEALECLQREPVDVILMDVQMPELDGLQATAAIRQLAEPRLASIPIIAMTAHAMQGDRERCLEAGMNEYVSKPIDPERLIALLEQDWIDPDCTCPPADTASPGPPPDDSEFDTDSSIDSPVTGKSPSDNEAVFDAKAALARLAGDRELFAEMINLYTEDAPRLLERLADGDDPSSVVRAAHSLKSLSANFDGHRVRQLAAEVEHRAAAGDTEFALCRLEELRARVRQLTEALHNYRESEPAEWRR